MYPYGTVSQSEIEPVYRYKDENHHKPMYPLVRDIGAECVTSKSLKGNFETSEVISFELSLYLFKLYNYRPLQLTFPIAISTITAVIRDDLPILIDE